MPNSFVIEQVGVWLQMRRGGDSVLIGTALASILEQGDPQEKKYWDDFQRRAEQWEARLGGKPWPLSLIIDASEDAGSGEIPPVPGREIAAGGWLAPKVIWEAGDANFPPDPQAALQALGAAERMLLEIGREMGAQIIRVELLGAGTAPLEILPVDPDDAATWEMARSVLENQILRNGCPPARIAGRRQGL